MSQDPPIVTLYFDFYGKSFDPKEISKRLAIEPTYQFQKGDPIPPLLSRNRRRDDWTLKVGSGETFEIDDLLDQLKAAVTASPKAIKEVLSEFDVEAEVTCEIIPADFIEWASARGATISVDIIGWPEKDQE